jgi:hypothetical protein
MPKLKFTDELIADINRQNTHRKVPGLKHVGRQVLTRKKIRKPPNSRRVQFNQDQIETLTRMFSRGPDWSKPLPTVLREWNTKTKTWSYVIDDGTTRDVMFDSYGWDSYIYDVYERKNSKSKSNSHRNSQNQHANGINCSPEDMAKTFVEDVELGERGPSNDDLKDYLIEFVPLLYTKKFYNAVKKIVRSDLSANVAFAHFVKEGTGRNSIHSVAKPQKLPYGGYAGKDWTDHAGYWTKGHSDSHIRSEIQLALNTIGKQDKISHVPIFCQSSENTTNGNLATSRTAALKTQDEVIARKIEEMDMLQRELPAEYRGTNEDKARESMKERVEEFKRIFTCIVGFVPHNKTIVEGKNHPTEEVVVDAHGNPAVLKDYARKAQPMVQAIETAEFEEKTAVLSKEIEEEFFGVAAE